NISSDGGQVEHDARNSRNNRGPADFDRTHRMTLAYVYEFPTPLARWTATKMVLGGWSFNGMLTVQSGSPFSVFGSSPSHRYLAQVARSRVDLAPGRTIDSARKDGPVENRLDQFFDPYAFVNSEDHWGNSGRNILRGPAQKQLDLALAKIARLREQMAM